MTGGFVTNPSEQDCTRGLSLTEQVVRRWLRPLKRLAHYLLDADLKHEDQDIAEEALAVWWRRYGERSSESAPSLPLAGRNGEDVHRQTGDSPQSVPAEQSDDVEQCGAFLFATARKLVLNKNRKRRCPSEADLDSDFLDTVVETRRSPPDLELARKERSEAIQQAISELPEEFRAVIVLCHIEERPLSEVAAILEIPIGTVKSRVARARDILRIKLAQWLDDQDSGERALSATGKE